MLAGILLPTSTTHPLLSHDFMAGIRSFLKYSDSSITLIPGYVGFGAHVDAVKTEVEKLILEHDPEVIIAFLDHPVVDSLFPLMAQLNKVLIVVNNGAKYAIDWKAPANVYFHTLENSYLSFLTAEHVSTLTKKAIMATSYYDGGYSLCHALTQPFLNRGAEIVFNFAGSYKKDEFDTSHLVDFLQINKDVKSMFTILSGELLPLFYQKLDAALPETELHFYGSPVTVEETIGLDKEFFPSKYTVTGFTSWLPDSGSSENRIFTETIRKISREPNSFIALGWDSGLILNEFARLAEFDGTQIHSLAANSFKEIKGAKGGLKLDEETHHFVGEAYHLKYNSSTGSELLATIDAASGRSIWNEMVTQKIEGITSGWLNTYLCS
jgi:branched-chain amino acid transport system substrate-binding protein